MEDKNGRYKEGELSMIDDVLKRELIEHKIFSAWQFMEYTEKI